jgi:uncharacterized protein with PIN domain
MERRNPYEPVGLKKCSNCKGSGLHIETKKSQYSELPNPYDLSRHKMCKCPQCGGSGLDSRR